MAEKSQAVDSTFNNYFEGRLDGHWPPIYTRHIYLEHFLGRKLLIIKDISTCISLKQNPNN